MSVWTMPPGTLTTIPLPLRVNHVFIVKFIFVFMGELLVSFFMVFPSLIAYAKVVDTGILFWIKSVIFILLNPIFPMAMVLILISILMKIFSKSRSKNIFQTLSILFGLVLGIGINILFRSNISGGDLAKLAIGYRELLQSFSKVFVTSELTIQSLKTSGVVDHSIGITASDCVQYGPGRRFEPETDLSADRKSADALGHQCGQGLPLLRHEPTDQKPGQDAGIAAAKVPKIVVRRHLAPVNRTALPHGGLDKRMAARRHDGSAVGPGHHVFRVPDDTRVVQNGGSGMQRQHGRSQEPDHIGAFDETATQIGRASCRERV